MPIDLNIQLPSAEDIQKQIAAAVASSAIGVELEKAVKSAVKELSDSYRNPFAGVIHTHMRETVIQLLNTTYKDALVEIVRKRLTDEYIDKLASKVLDGLLQAKISYE